MRLFQFLENHKSLPPEYKPQWKINKFFQKEMNSTFCIVTVADQRSENVFDRLDDRSK